MVRAKVSAPTNKTAPNTTDAGNKYSKSEPTTSRIKCGTMRPTKPSKPATLTEAAAKMAAKSTKMMRVFFKLMPRDKATSSPICKAFSLR